MTKHEWIVKVALSHLGTFYTWGGDDPSGFDCSGLAVECLKSVGSIARGTDYTAQGLYTLFPEVEKSEPGHLVFWKLGEQVVHVEICIGNGLAIGASGGGRSVVDRKSAIEANAFVKVRPMASRTGLRWYADPVG